MDSFSSILKKIRQQQSLLISLVIIGFTAIIGLTIYHSYNKQIQILKSEKLNQLNAIVKSTVVSINGDEYENILELDADKLSESRNTYYFDLKKLLKEIQKSNGLNSEIYTLSKMAANDAELFLIANSGDSIYFKNKYQSPKALVSKYIKGGTLGPYTDEYGTWLSAFTPIKNSKGTVVGSLQADIKFNEFERLVSKNITDEIQTTILEISLVILVFFVFTRLKIGNIKRLQNTFQNLSKTLSLRNKQLETAQTNISAKNKDLADLNNGLKESIRVATQKIMYQKEELQLFFYHASHKMKTPIVNIQGLVELAKMDSNEKNGEIYLSKISKLTKRTTRFLDQANKISHINDGQIETIHLSDFIKGCGKNNPYRHCVNIDSKCNVELKCNPYLLQIILDAVIENAVFFSRKARLESAKVEINCHVDSSYIITIKDNGSGINPEILSSCFDMFFVGSNLSKGNGMGLYLAKKAIDELNGRINLNSEPNEFTEVIIEIPKVS